MTRCKDCIHYDVCGYHIDEETDMTIAECGKLKNKADYVEVVRCKDCKHCWKYMGIDKMHYMKCTFDTEYDIPIHEMHFCGYGERKEGAK